MQSFPWGELLDWYRQNGRHHLPWRDYKIPDENILLYRIWLSEIFLQQTQVSRVIDYFERVTKAFPNVGSLAHTEYETFFPYYQGLGYYSRARNILKTARIISEEYCGNFPKEKKILEKLPGVGPYTAHALLAFGYGESYLAWDTNLEKVFSRYYKGRKDIKLTLEEKDTIENDFRHFCSYSSIGIVSSIGTDQDSTPLDPSFHSGGQNKEATLKKKDMIRSINNALMDFAALADLKNPQLIDWENYPIQSGAFYSNRGALEPMEVKKASTFPVPDATVVVVLHKDHKLYYSIPISAIPGSSRNPVKKNIIPKEHGFLQMQEGQEHYIPFILPPPLHRDTRKYIQDSFRTDYNLELSVRPIHKKWISRDGKPYVLVHAQIQTGKHTFIEFHKKEYLSFLEGIE